MRKGEKGLLFISRSVTHRPLDNHGLGPACQLPPPPGSRWGEPWGTRGAGRLAAAAGMPVQAVFSCCRCPREQAGVEPRRLGCPAALCKALGPELWPSSPLRPLPTPWDAGLRSGQVSLQGLWAVCLPEMGPPGWKAPGVRDGWRTSRSYRVSRSGFRSHLFQLCDYGQVTLLSLRVFLCKPHSLPNLTNIAEHPLYAGGL